MIPRVAITDPFLIAFLFAVVAAVVCMGRASFATGLFCSTWSFAFNVDIGPSTMLRIGVGAMLCAGLAFSFKKRHGVGRTLTAPSVRNYVIVLAAWAGWIGITYVTGDQSELSILIIKNQLRKELGRHLSTAGYPVENPGGLLPHRAPNRPIQGAGV